MRTTTKPFEPGAVRATIQGNHANEAHNLAAFEALEAWLEEKCAKKGGPVTITKREKPAIEAAICAATGAEPEDIWWPTGWRRSIEHRDYTRSDCREGWSISLSRFDQTGCPCLDPELLRELNAPFTAAREERQPQRLELLAGDLPERIEAAALAAKEALATYRQLLERTPDRVAVEKAVQLEAPLA